MEIKVLFFGVLAEKAGTDKISIDKTSDLANLEKQILGKYPEFGTFSYRISVNRIIVSGNEKLKEGDEVAFMPPFAGG